MPNSPRAGTHTRSLRIDDTLWARVQAAAEREGVTASTITRKALESYTMIPSLTVRHGQFVAYVGDNTPDYLEYGKYRGWVLLAEDGTYEHGLTEAEVAALPVKWDEFTNGEYERTGTL